MARMHSRDKGKSGSKKPIPKIPSWARYKGPEVEKLIIKLAKVDTTTSEMGMILRDNYGINSVKALTEKTITQILKENKLTKELPEDLMALIVKFVDVKKHLEKNRQDMTAKRGLQLTSSKIRRLMKYYKKTNKLPQDWKFDEEKVKMYLH
ncbi:30S ribosomal protein S15 [Candidatus Woesearchaeota archaeon]|jgi:small subunit ribosomal protein S15|nr:30S ribosomal protein S15 [Candidatus Woesearchaeota archaeon]